MPVVPFPDPKKDSSARAVSESWFDDDDELEGSGGKMSFLEHLDELRKRIIRALYALVLGVAVAAFFINDIVDFVMRPLSATLPPGGKFIYTYPTEAFMLDIRIALLAGLFIGSPFIFRQVWMFVAPALYARERKYAIPFVILSTAGFMAGAAFSHYVAFPLMWRFFGTFANDIITFMPRIEDTFSMYIRMLLGMAVVFQMPALVFFMARMGVVTARWMIRQFKYAVLVIVVVAAIITPSSDVASQMIVAGPMVVLYLISIVIAAIFGKKKSATAE